MKLAKNLSLQIHQSQNNRQRSFNYQENFRKYQTRKKKSSASL